MKVDLDTVVTQHQAAELLGARDGTVAMWRKREVGFPEPVAEIANTKLFDRQAVLDWNEKRLEKQARQQSRESLQTQIDDLVKRVEVLEGGKS